MNETRGALALRWRGPADIARQHHAALDELIDPATATLGLFIGADDSEPSDLEVIVITPDALDDLHDLVALVLGTDANGLTVEELPETDWVAQSQRFLAPVRAGRFVIHGSHDRHRGRLSRHAIEIDAGQAFGTAHHETTVGCLKAIDAITRRTHLGRVADIGTGSGILAIAVARTAPEATIVASDIDPIAVRVAEENARLNGCADRIAFLVATGLNHPAFRTTPPYDLVIANILAGPLITMAPAFRPHVTPGGGLILSGLLVRQAQKVIAAYRAAGFRLAERRDIGAWSTLTLRRNDLRRRA